MDNETQQGSAVDLWMERCVDFIMSEDDRAAWSAARAEVAAMRQRVADLELIARASCTRNPSLRAIFAPRMDGKAYVLRDYQKSGREEDLIYLADDGTGLPLLTPEARQALEGKT